MKKKTDTPLNSRQFISACRELLSDQFLCGVFHVGADTILRYCAQKDFVSEEYPRENPIEKFERILERLMDEPGGEKIAQSIVRRHAGIVGCRIVPEDLPEPDKKTMAEECLDDLPALAKYHAVLADKKATVEQIRAARAELDDELNQNEAMAIRRA